jgi:hypothetical protein
MRVFEESLQRTLDSDGVAIFAFTFTSAGVRKLHYYFGDTSETQKRINQALSYNPNLPISLVAARDENWSELTKILDQCK